MPINTLPPLLLELGGPAVLLSRPSGAPPRNEDGARPLGGVDVAATGFRPPVPFTSGDAAAECPALVATAGLFVLAVAAAALSKLGAGG